MLAKVNRSLINPWSCRTNAPWQSFCDDTLKIDLDGFGFDFGVRLFDKLLYRLFFFFVLLNELLHILRHLIRINVLLLPGLLYR